MFSPQHGAKPFLLKRLSRPLNKRLAFGPGNGLLIIRHMAEELPLGW